jgi:hypothetical protein
VYCCKDGQCATESECLYQKVFVSITVLTIGCLFLVIIVRVIIGCKSDLSISLHSTDAYKIFEKKSYEFRMLNKNQLIYVAPHINLEPKISTVYFPIDDMQTMEQILLISSRGRSMSLIQRRRPKISMDDTNQNTGNSCTKKSKNFEITLEPTSINYKDTESLAVPDTIMSAKSV